MPPEDSQAENGPRVEVETQFIILEEWAEGAAKLCFVPASRLIHPAFKLTDAEAEDIGPKMQAFLQAVCDKWAPPLVARLMGKYPEFFDLLGAVSVLHYQKWRYVQKIVAWEAQKKAEASQPGERPIDAQADPAPSPEMPRPESASSSLEGPAI
ncbi:MAG TPA: hypothetical protein VKP61_08785 [Candidatus Acidoferrum sp.]|nr:hypothetical protein [Candidatus Acidoferrum sp.]